MDSVDTEVLKSAVAWIDSGHQATLATVVRTWGSAPRPVGAMLVIRDDGHVIGSVSGGCVEDDLIERVKAHQMKGGTPEVVTYGVTAEQAARFGLPCGGTLQLVLEPVRRDSQLKELLDTIEPSRTGRALSRHEIGRRQTRIGPLVRRARVRRHGLEKHPRAALAPADHRRRPDFALSGADGAGARLPGHGVRSARGIRRRVERAGRDLVRSYPDDAVLAVECRPASGGGRGHPRPEARRRRADRGAQVAVLLRRCARLARRTTRSAASGSPNSTCRRRKSRACTARSGSRSAARRRRRSRLPSSPR